MITKTRNKKEENKTLLLKLKTIKRKKVSFTNDTPITTNSRKSKVCCLYKLGKNKKKNKYERID